MEFELIDFLSNHLVALVGDGERFENGKSVKKGVFCFSGFIVDLNGDWYWTTAGHCLKEFDKSLKNGDLTASSISFLDYFGMDSSDDHPIPYPYEPGCATFLDSPEDGLDYGLIKIPPLTQLAFEKNKIRPVCEANWASISELTFTAYKMLGIPSHLVDEIPIGDDIRALFPNALLHVHRISPADVPTISNDEWFVGKLADESTISNIEGMSGGPIMGFRQIGTGQWVYHVIAIQSRWLPNSRIVLGCSIPRFVEAARHALTTGHDD